MGDQRKTRPAWLERIFRSGFELALPRRLLVPYLSILSGDQFKVYVRRVIRR